jgi:hypothetical protein
VDVGVAVGVRVAVLVALRVGVRVSATVAVSVAVAVRVGVFGVPARMAVLANVAPSPEFVPSPSTALPHASSVTLLKEAGAVQRKENVMTPPEASFGLLCVTSARPPVPLSTCVFAALLPPVASLPDGADTLNPA